MKNHLTKLVKHHLTKYRSNDKKYVASWMQISLFGKQLCFSKKALEI
ncbi:MAG: hypothetical protein JJE03_07125 [Peptostreptococcaceae bacterium]|nr:hypothetical protein [Peptostreptococcaceae bacterium]